MKKLSFLNDADRFQYGNRIEKDSENQDDFTDALNPWLVTANNNIFLLHLYKTLKSIHSGENINIIEINSLLSVLESSISSIGVNGSQIKFDTVNTSSLKRKLLFLDSRLTKSEIRVCELLKAGLTCKQVAGLMNLSPRTIETHRLNIRRKLKLNAKTNLDAFIINL